MKYELQLLSETQLLKEIQKLWYYIGQIEYEHNQENEEYSISDDYMMSDIEHRIEALEKEYTGRGFKLPNRAEFVAQFDDNEALL